ncbi:MAG: protein jag [Firmicutes bacterium]|nr:protein jag [Bacillota bacterium]
METVTVERVGKTKEDAIAAALKILDLTIDQVDITIIDEGSKGFLGLIGNKPAKVSVTKKIGPIELAERFLLEVTEAMGMLVKLEMNRKEKHLHVNLIGQNMGVLIGKRGQTLDALQYLTNLVINRCGVPEFSIVLDTENYRKRRRETLEGLAISLARKVKATKKNVVLEPMSRYERHIIHTILQKDTAVRTFSEGVDPYRNVIIAPKLAYDELDKTDKTDKTDKKDKKNKWDKWDKAENSGTSENPHFRTSSKPPRQRTRRPRKSSYKPEHNPQNIDNVDQ